jgi:4-amino-4-deoxy-L-arabinose transferase-like glycosyltransferase
VRQEVLIVSALGAIALLAHGINMFDYPAPSLADDEGTYVSQAWAVLREGRLSPYTYTYDHVPGGWLQIAAWFGVVGPRAFGSVTATARVLMLLLHVAAVVLLYFAGRRLGIGRPAAGIAALAFAASPLAVFYGRQAILDNIMAFWLVAALAIVAGTRSTRGTVLAGFALGIATLSKEPALVLVPVYALLAAIQAPPGGRLVRVLATAAPALAVAAAYPLYAVAHDQFWPTVGFENTAKDPRAYAASSLMDSILWQMGRRGGSPIEPDSRVYLSLGDWLQRDAPLVLVGAASALANALRFRREPTRAVIGILAIISLGFLMRGGIVFAFHVPLAIPFLALNFGLGSLDLVGSIRPRALAARPALTSCVGLLVLWGATSLPHLYLDHPGVAERAAVAWIQQAVPMDAIIVGRDDMWADLHETNGTTAFGNFHTHWRLTYDPTARRAVLAQGWRSLDYIVITADMLKDIKQITHDGQLMAALRNAHLVAQWIAPTSNERLHPAQVIEIWEVDRTGTSVRLLVDCDSTPSLVCAITRSAPSMRPQSAGSPSPSVRY